MFFDDSWRLYDAHCQCRVPLSNSGVTYVFVTEDVVQELFASLKLSYPNLPALNTTGVLQGNDTLPSGINATALVAAGTKIIQLRLKAKC